MMLLAEPTAESATNTIRPPRQYLPEDFIVTDWAAIEPFFQELQNRSLFSSAELERWLLDRSELEAVLSEDLAWRYIRMTCDTQDPSRAEAFQYFVNEVEPLVAPYDHALNEKSWPRPTSGLDERRTACSALGAPGPEIYRVENIPSNRISTKQQQYAATWAP
jgi:oligoendopeptidase F